VERDAIVQPVEERNSDLLRGRRAEADRIRAADVERDAVVSDRWRQIQHVARAEQPFVLGAEAREDLERQTRLERKVALPADAPEGTVRKRPATAFAPHGPRLDVVAGCEREQLALREQALESRDRLPDQQRPLLPITPQKARRRGAAQERGFHWAIIAAGRL